MKFFLRSIWKNLHLTEFFTRAAPVVPVTNMRYGQDVFCVLQTTLLKLPCLQNVHSTHLTWNHLPTPHILLSLVTSSRSCRSTQKDFKDKCFRLKLMMHQSCTVLSQHWGKRNVIFTRGGDRRPKYPDCILTMLQALLVE